MTITTRADKGAALTHAELDENFTDLRDNPTGIVLPKTISTGIKVDPSAPTFGWRDLMGVGFTDPLAAVQPTMEFFSGTISEFNFAENASMLVRFHLPHDYVVGTDLFIHVHWSVNSATLTGGSVTWGTEITYAKGHDRGAFLPSKVVTVSDNASLIPLQHMITESVLTVVGGTSVNHDTNDIEPDGMLLGRFFLDSNDLTDSVSVPNPFVHGVDIHYQSTNVGTKQKEPDFWT